MVSFAQFLQNAGIHMAPALFIGIIAGVLLFILVLVFTVVYVHGRNKRKLKEGDFDNPAFSVLSLAQPRPGLPTYHTAHRSSVVDREAQKQELVGREVRQQEATYAQLIKDLSRPSLDAQSLPNQSPRMVQRNPLQAAQVALPRSPLVEYPNVNAPAPVATAPTPPPAAGLSAAEKATHLKRGLSVRSLDSASAYSVASAPRDPYEPAYQSFNLPTIPQSPATPTATKWPSSPGPYAWPKRQRASQIREELAPETYAKVRWRTNDESVDPAASIPVAQAVPTSPVGIPPSLRINVPPPAAYYRGGMGTAGDSPQGTQSPKSPDSTTTAHLFYASAATTVTTTQRPF